MWSVGRRLKERPCRSRARPGERPWSSARAACRHLWRSLRQRCPLQTRCPATERAQAGRRTPRRPRAPKKPATTGGDTSRWCTFGSEAPGKGTSFARTRRAHTRDRKGREEREGKEGGGGRGRVFVAVHASLYWVGSLGFAFVLKSCVLVSRRHTHAAVQGVGGKWEGGSHRCRVSFCGFFLLHDCKKRPSEAFAIPAKPNQPVLRIPYVTRLCRYGVCTFEAIFPTCAIPFLLQLQFPPLFIYVPTAQNRLLIGNLCKEKRREKGWGCSGRHCRLARGGEGVRWGGVYKRGWFFFQGKFRSVVVDWVFVFFVVVFLLFLCAFRWGISYVLLCLLFPVARGRGSHAAKAETQY